MDVVDIMHLYGIMAKRLVRSGTHVSFVKTEELEHKNTTMKKRYINIFILCLIFAMSSCGYEIRKKPEPPKPKLTKEQIRKQEYEQRLKDNEVKFLFEFNDVKVYRFRDCETGKIVYFTNANGMTKYQYTTRSGKFSHTTHTVQSLNTKK